MMLGDYITLHDGDTFLLIKVIPNSTTTEFVEKMNNGVFKIRAKGVPEKGKVNKEICKFLAKELAIDKKQIVIVSGKTSFLKKIKISI